MTQASARTPRWWNYWGWGSGDMLGAGAQAVITGWLFYFFTTFCELSPVQAGLILGLPRLLEAVTCPLIGYISDNLRQTWIGSRVGRRKIFLLIVTPLLPCFALIFVTGQTFLYYLSVFVAFELLYTMFLIPWETLAAEMTKDYKEKARFAGARILTGQASAIFASLLPVLIINTLGGRDSADTFLIMGVIFGVMFSLVVVLVIVSSWERPYDAQEAALPSARLDMASALRLPGRMFADLFSTLRIRAFRQHLSIYLGGYIAQDVFNTAFPIFVTVVVMGATAIISQMMTLMYVAQLVSVFAAISLVIRIGPAAAYRIASAFFCAALVLFAAFYLIRPPVLADGFLSGLASTETGFDASALFWLGLPIVLAGLGRGTLNYIPWSVYNYLPDIDEAVTGRRREGVFAGVMTLVRKLAQSLAIIVTGWIIGLGGYISEAPAQTPTASAVVAGVVILGPILVMTLGLIGAWGFRLNSNTHQILMLEIERLRSGATTPSSPEAATVVETLTGWRYDNLWGRAARNGRGKT